ncbi:MAG TPA: isoprenylcysteine carboxylmethyltransferase family protein [Bryobacteraceae bacterium]|nr:isoprenylcysteine carboxylmethyltransferase family protein [Bryobacteraceae bacterium]
MKKTMVLAYGIFAYAVFFVTFLYAMGFVANMAVPKSIDSGETGPVLAAVLINSLLLGSFAVQHTIMARRSFKKWVTRYIPAAVERSTFVLVASAILAITFWQWRPMTGIVWRVEGEEARLVLNVIYWFGWFLVLFSSFLINHFDLFGLRQVYLEFRNRPVQPLVFRMTGLYKLVRHPLLLGFLIAFWSAPVMTEGRLLFATLTTAYILVGIRFEERDLEHTHGEVYREYQRNVPMLIPYRKPPSPAAGTATAARRA